MLFLQKKQIREIFDINFISFIFDVSSVVISGWVTSAVIHGSLNNVIALGYFGIQRLPLSCLQNEDTLTDICPT